MSKRLLVTEFWGLGDLAIASEFLKRASAEFDLMLLAKPYATDLAKELWPNIHVLSFVAPWTQFRGKYRLHRWPWSELKKVIAEIRAFNPQVALSGRWDPRDHVMLRLSGARRRIGFPRRGSQVLLTDALPLVDQDAPRTAQWDAISHHLQLLPAPCTKTASESERKLVVHSGAAQALRVWPIKRYATLVEQIRNKGWKTHILCDQSQMEEWQDQGEDPVVPTSPLELIQELKWGSMFVGNDSGPGHLAAALGIPTFTIFGPQRPEWFLPNHPKAGWIEGKPCPHKPCFDYCRFPTPSCIQDLRLEEVSTKIHDWLSTIESA